MSTTSSEGSSTISSQDNQENLNLASVNNAAIPSNNAISGLNVESSHGNEGFIRPGESVAVSTVGARGDAVSYQAPSLLTLPSALGI